MGRHARLASALFSSLQQRLMALLIGQPERTFQSAELIRLAKGGTGGAHRQLVRLAEAGWLTVARVGNQKHYRANREAPGYRELHALVTRLLVAAPQERRRRRAERDTAPRPEPAPPVPAPAESELAAPVPDRNASTSPSDGWKAW